ncbi:MFS transporter [Syntrophaceticus schinkii]|jgi:MFS family permease|uniref:Nitrate transporter (MFS general substrate transporter) n=1 Tax=Syntrophaceticus schinkii TaxID=499207 RepID=A0A0B7MLF6_9FIRM|nr:MFS transporter [Syntrophaceticus schinkii]MDD2360787.1 MFS transporter [Syntrophaceticus schinkii]CEO88507.1 Nitrate transporter (MFS general substrate transporter) [Syntrophaceticus schinkii]HHV41381.1 MFS transporter [Clostridiaceae bacterium]
MEKSPYKYVLVFIMTFGLCFSGFTNVIYAARALDVMQIFNMSQAQLSAISSVSNLPAFFFAIWLGNLIDKRGVRKIPIILFALATVAGVARVFSPNYTILFLLTFLGCTFFLPVNIIAPKLFAPYFSAGEMGAAIGVYSSGAGLGTTLAFALGPMFSSTKAALAFIAAGYAVMMILWIIFVKEPPKAENAPAMQKTDMKAVLKSKTMWKVMLCGGLAVGAAILLNSYAVTAFIGKGMEPAAASVIATIMNFCLLVGGVVAGFIVSKVGRYNVPYVIICVGGAILYYLAYWLPVGTITYVMIGIAAFVVAGSIGVNMGRIALIPVTGEFGPENIGAAGGMNQTAVGLIGFILPTIAASIFGTNYMGVWTFAAVILVIIGILGGVLTPELGPKGKLAQEQASAATGK